MLSLSRRHLAILVLRASPIKSRTAPTLQRPPRSNLTVLPSSTTAQLFAYSDTPANLSDPDTSGVNLGVKFESSQSGLITGLKYYKGLGDTGTHVGSLWTSDGTLLASAAFTNETASGWQYVTFANPVSISASTTYVASYSSNGHYASTGNYFTTTYTNGVLSTPGPGAGVYTYGAGALFPTSVSTANYWVDVLFDPPLGSNVAPVFSSPATASFAENAVGTALAVTATDANADPLTFFAGGRRRRLILHDQHRPG